MLCVLISLIPPVVVEEIQGWKLIRVMGKRKNSEKYHRIIEAATKVFAKKGFYQAKISEIAREAGVADGTIYIYFENKDEYREKK